MINQVRARNPWFWSNDFPFPFSSYPSIQNPDPSAWSYYILHWSSVCWLVLVVLKCLSHDCYYNNNVLDVWCCPRCCPRCVLSLLSSEKKSKVEKFFLSHFWQEKDTTAPCWNFFFSFRKKKKVKREKGKKGRFVVECLCPWIQTVGVLVSSCPLVSSGEWIKKIYIQQYYGTYTRRVWCYICISKCVYLCI